MKKNFTVLRDPDMGYRDFYYADLIDFNFNVLICNFHEIIS